ncbi:MAG: hypothetical protein WBD20_23525 [Pirellulaceae bacterium]
MIAPIQKNRIGHYYDDDVASRPRTSNDRTDQSLQVIRDNIGNHPVAAIVVAAVVGVTAAWIIKRGIR